MVDMNSRLVIGGKLVDAQGGATYPNVNPYSEQPIGVAADAGIDDVNAAVLAAHQAHQTTDWSRNHAFRAKCLRQYREALLNHIEELRETLVAEVGCPIFMTKGLQLEEPIRGFEWHADLAESYAFDSYMADDPTTSPPSKRLIIREPWGVCALITPYNYPVQQYATKVGPALAAGNTVVVKPSPLTPLTTYLMGKIAAEETDIPPGVLNIITGGAPEVGQALVEHPLVEMIHFTGSTPVGQQIYRSAAAGVKKIGLELGGKSANIILDDADIEAAVRANIYRVSRFSGQGCSNLTRMLLPRSKYEYGLEVAADECSKIVWGDPLDPKTHLGPQINRAGQERCLRYIGIGKEEGGRIIAGGGIPAGHTTGYFVEATVIADLSPDARVCQEEIFGPILAVMPFDSDDEAVAIANNSAFGLAGSVQGATDRALAVARRVKAGTMEISGASRQAPDTPFGGMKLSGIGRERGYVGFEEYLDLRVIAHF
ncbi:aldehyde dehydrogenase [soil metagenome]